MVADWYESLKSVAPPPELAIVFEEVKPATTASTTGATATSASSAPTGAPGAPTGTSAGATTSAATTNGQRITKVVPVSAAAVAGGIRPGMKMLVTTDLQLKKAAPKENTSLQGKAIIEWVNFVVCHEKSGMRMLARGHNSYTFTGLSILNIANDLRDGLILAVLLEVLFGQKVKVKSAGTVFDFNPNVTVTLEALKAVGVNVGTITVNDVVESKNSKLLYTLLWNIFFRYMGGEKGTTAHISIVWS